MTFFLILHIKQDKYGIFTSQVKYIKELLKKFNLEYMKFSLTPMNTTTKLDKVELGKKVNIIKYRGLISSLLLFNGK
jgi:hypothetical protein